MWKKDATTCVRIFICEYWTIQYFSLINWVYSFQMRPDEALEMISWNYLQNSTIPGNKKLRITKACRHFHLSAGYVSFIYIFLEDEPWLPQTILFYPGPLISASLSDSPYHPLLLPILRSYNLTKAENLIYYFAKNKQNYGH